jgi:hypothetical protein
MPLPTNLALTISNYGVKLKIPFGAVWFTTVTQMATVMIRSGNKFE